MNKYNFSLNVIRRESEAESEHNRVKQMIEKREREREKERKDKPSQRCELKVNMFVHQDDKEDD